LTQRIFIAIRVPDRHDQRIVVAETIKEAARRAGYQPFVAYQEIQSLGLSTGKEFMPFAREQMRLCDLVLIAYDPDLRGGLIEAGMAYAWGIPIWVVHPVGIRVSSSLLGCAEQVIAYQDLQDMTDQLASALDDWQHK